MSNKHKFETIYEGENAIQQMIKNDNNCSAHFEYHNSLGNVELIVVTYNPKHKTFFFLHSLVAPTKKKALSEMYEHIYKLKYTLTKKDSPYFNYTITWYNSKDNKQHESSFYGENIQQVISKFYYGKHNKCKDTIYKIILNPANPEC
tara:strand:+ start:66 stop:506 length:441 start_codon:yes stop_codon:yes gene_type:complete